MIESLAAYGYGGGGSGGAYWAIVAVVAGAGRRGIVAVHPGWKWPCSPARLAEHPEGRPPRGEVNTP